MNSKAALAIFTVLLGCGLNNIFLEYIIKLDPGCGHLITFLQFLFIAVHGFIFTHKFGTVKPKIALKEYLILVTMFFVTSVVNNWAFNFNIPVPLHMIFRAGSLIANLIMGKFILKKKYPFGKYLSVGMITIGIIVCTYYSSQNSSAKKCIDCDMTVNTNNTQAPEDPNYFFWWAIGIALLTFALLLSARMGIYQESLYTRRGKHPSEALYYTHLYSLPGFLLYSSSIMEHIAVANGSEPFEIPILKFALPLIWVYLVLNVVTQYLCISSVYVLTTECSSLTVTLVITLRKFLSLIFSIVYFQNPFTFAHWLGTALVFVGTLLFAEVPTRVLSGLSKTEKSKKKD
ncbi:unnamed protein product [Brassicogethes aeneus]|uniref:UDP-xylose and UDP-N-acetylglucosamine transporter n=1 Tax=Brassicogethes aeneus TaxID=1431903 RepID=A0A9P0BE79_BRAAE|nr:unnamed protein product [Brassicogethes aeneus]